MNVTNLDVIIYHNPKCSKSRAALTLIQNKGITPEIRLYLKQKELAKEELLNIMRILQADVAEIFRFNENVTSKTSDQLKAISDVRLFDILMSNPICLQRPIILINKKYGIIARTDRSVKKLNNLLK